jgi:hypothetical protein
VYGSDDEKNVTILCCEIKDNINGQNKDQNIMITIRYSTAAVVKQS